MDINIRTIPHSEQRYPTVGDWWFDEAGNLQIRVSKMSDDRFESLVAFHELAEVLLCRKAGVTQEDADDFDIAFENERAAGLHPQDAEPGDSDDAPYREQHSMATALERALSVALGVNWKEYDDEVMALGNKTEGG